MKEKHRTKREHDPSFREWPHGRASGIGSTAWKLAWAGAGVTFYLVVAYGCEALG